MHSMFARKGRRRSSRRHHTSSSRRRATSTAHASGAEDSGSDDDGGSNLPDVEYVANAADMYGYTNPLRQRALRLSLIIWAITSVFAHGLMRNWLAALVSPYMTIAGQSVVLVGAVGGWTLASPRQQLRNTTRVAQWVIANLFADGAAVGSAVLICFAALVHGHGMQYQGWLPDSTPAPAAGAAGAGGAWSMSAVGTAVWVTAEAMFAVLALVIEHNQLAATRAAASQPGYILKAGRAGRRRGLRRGRSRTNSESMERGPLEHHNAAAARGRSNRVWSIISADCAAVGHGVMWFLIASGSRLVSLCVVFALVTGALCLEAAWEGRLSNMPLLRYVGACWVTSTACLLFYGMSSGWEFPLLPVLPAFKA